MAVKGSGSKVQLHFISSRVSSKSCAGHSEDTEQLLIDLQQCHDISRPSQHKTWTDKVITPLRDRTMISWLFGFAVANNYLKKLISKVDKLLSDHHEQQQYKLVVHCENGKQLSVAFVEKLYDHYCYESDHRNNVSVTRTHRDAFTGEWGKNKRFVWQRYHKAHLGSRDRPMDSNISFSFYLWRVCPSDAVEEAFQKDPYASEVSVDNFVYDFYAGFVSHKSGHQYRLRCTMIPSEDQFLSYKPLTVDSFKTAARQYYAAGMLPCATEPVTNETVCLLGEMTYETCTWCDFGGLRGRLKFWEDASQTAARECHEETLGVIGNYDELHALATKDDVFKVYNVGTNYIAHFVLVPYQDYPTMFDKAVGECSGSLEVCRLRWVRIGDLRSAVRQACQQVSCNHIRVNTLPTGPKDKSKDCELRSEFVSSLCIAEKLGFLSALERRTMKGRDSDSVNYNRSDSYKAAVQQEVNRLGRGKFTSITF